MLILRITHGLMLGQHYELNDVQQHRIGRHDGTVALLDDKVSRTHAELYVEDGRWLLRDLESTNGTFLNGQRMVNATALSEKDVIQVGMTVMLVEAVTLGDVEEQAASVEVPTSPPPPRFTPATPPSTTQPIQQYPSQVGQPQALPGRRIDRPQQPTFTGRPTPAAWALVGYSVLTVAGVLVDFLFG